jgi:hypothetical protein
MNPLMSAEAYQSPIARTRETGGALRRPVKWISDRKEFEPSPGLTERGSVGVGAPQVTTRQKCGFNISLIDDVSTASQHLLRFEADGCGMMGTLVRAECKQSAMPILLL